MSFYFMLWKGGKRGCWLEGSWREVWGAELSDKD